MRAGQRQGCGRVIVSDVEPPGFVADSQGPFHVGIHLDDPSNKTGTTSEIVDEPFAVA